MINLVRMTSSLSVEKTQNHPFFVKPIMGKMQSFLSHSVVWKNEKFGLIKKKFVKSIYYKTLL